jgi:hypothetical protein
MGPAIQRLRPDGLGGQLCIRGNIWADEITIMKLWQAATNGSLRVDGLAE